MAASKNTPLLIVDLEATCWENSRLPSGERQSIGNMEIIEFGCALATRAGELLNSQSFLVRPVRNPDLSAFCRSLTGITQAMVNAAQVYPEVVRALDSWLGQPAESLVWCSWGNYDRHHIQAESEAQSIAPRFLSCPHLNLKRIWRRSTRQKKKTGLASALAFHNLAFEGRPHRGVDDARNIVRLLPFMDWELEPELLTRSVSHVDS
ncbi:inhibitor of KinA sporulation pathway (predicted exonuclease) [Marinobacter pelagius]|uniref:Inhibitor of KinA sporulation pathway (Predicted exonuclease) n=1 Tax=Marinobacter pelagius TaxID=379482 RepID=A0A366GL36_9GAMM|nr:3'-5' exonuclease [Marinobacter pelagius]RBP27910.1 inhibitor of KinA sporulation pathway (predicted exonuclease) [Marinobacter pelagius]